jgi:hypothetical protein
MVDICRGRAMPRRFSLFLLSLLVAAGFAASVRAHAQDDPLTEDEVQQIRESKINPNERVKLYLKFIDQRLDAIKQLAGSGKSAKEKAQIHDKFEEFSQVAQGSGRGYSPVANRSERGRFRPRLRLLAEDRAGGSQECRGRGASDVAGAAGLLRRAQEGARRHRHRSQLGNLR